MLGATDLVTHRKRFVAAVKLSGSDSLPHWELSSRPYIPQKFTSKTPFRGLSHFRYATLSLIFYKCHSICLEFFLFLVDTSRSIMVHL